MLIMYKTHMDFDSNNWPILDSIYGHDFFAYILVIPIHRRLYEFYVSSEVIEGKKKNEGRQPGTQILGYFLTRYQDNKYAI